MFRKITTAAVVLTVGATLVASPAYAKPVKANPRGYIAMYQGECHTTQGWRADARRNGVTPTNGWMIYANRYYDVRCPGSVAANAPRPPKATKLTGWVHPLASGKRGSGGGCFGVARPGHTHKGVDLAQPSGTRIRAVHTGRVVVVRYQAGGAGWYVALSHGAYQTVYMHMRSRPPVHVGQKVATGQTIGYVGSTGASSGPHLHFEVHHGLWHPVNPAPFMRHLGISVGC